MKGSDRETYEINGTMGTSNPVFIHKSVDEELPTNDGKNKYSLQDNGTRSSDNKGSMSKVQMIFDTYKVLILQMIVAILYYVYFGYALAVQFGDESSWRLLIFTVAGTSLVAWRAFKKTKLREKICVLPPLLSNQRLRKISRWALYFIAIISMVGYLVVYVVRDHPENLVSLGGAAIFLFALFQTSTNKSKIRWHTVFWGMTIQFAFAVIFLKWTSGVMALSWVSDRLEEFTAHAHSGSEFVIGKDYAEFQFIFKMTMPQVLVFVVMISTINYLGVTAFIIENVGGLLSYLLDSDPYESVVAVANIFLGTNGSLMLIRQYLSDLSKSQLFCMLVCGMSSMAGAAMITMKTFGIPIEYLLSASVLSAPAALVSSCLSMPDENDKDDDIKQKLKLERDTGGANNILEALARGINHGARVVGALIVNMLVFIALASFIDATFVWFGERIGIQDLSFQRICSYILWPVAFIMGTSMADSGRVAEQIGVRLMTNPGVAYINIGALLENRKTYLQYSATYNDTIFIPNGDVFLPGLNTTLANGFLDARSEVVVIYALCGFACLPNIGMQLGVISALAPKRLNEITGYMGRVFIVSTIASFLTACMAGLLFLGE